VARHNTRLDDHASPATIGSLPLTGERTVPGIPEENYWFRRHEVAYRFALPLVAGKRVLEVGCGEGYGTSLLASSASHVVGLDYDRPRCRAVPRGTVRARQPCRASAAGRVG
jgi:2-polyprenyl-3-methyl-5-hydroxy-6-metoxy-1,4-benzoquinol methylase